MMTIVYKKVSGINIVAYNNYTAANIEKRGILITIECDIRCYTSQRTDDSNCLPPGAVYVYLCSRSISIANGTQ
jgi:hypothetical protein